MSQTIEAPVEVRLPDEDNEHDHDRPWIVIVWNDPINLMSYVTFVLRKLFGFSEEEATKLMLQVHNDGKAVVSSGEKEKAEFDVARLHAHGSVGNAQAGLMAKRSIKRDRKGGYTLQLPPDERELLRSLPAQFREVLQTDDPSLRRIFPPAYTDDDDANDEFQRLMREELLEGKLAALEIVEQTAGADHLTGEQLEGWLGALESLRLFLGTQLDVSEELYAVELDPDDPSAPALALVRLPELAAGAGGRGAVDRALAGVYGSTSTRPAGSSRLACTASSIASSGKISPSSGASSSRPAATCSSRIGSATAGSSEPYIVPVRNFSRRRNSPGSRSSRSPVGGSPTITVVPPLRVKRNAVALVSGNPTASKP